MKNNSKSKDNKKALSPQVRVLEEGLRRMELSVQVLHRDLRTLDQGVAAFYRFRTYWTGFLDFVYSIFGPLWPSRANNDV